MHGFGKNSLKNVCRQAKRSPNMVQKTKIQTLWASFAPRTLYAIGRQNKEKKL
jgi:hypothetical protein